MSEGNPHERHNREFWDADADDYQAVHGDELAAEPRAWGVWRIPDADVGVLGDVRGLDVLEYGCGAAQWSIAPQPTAPAGADQSIGQLKRGCQSRRGVPSSRSSQRAGGGTLRQASFDVAYCDAARWASAIPATVPEVATSCAPAASWVRPDLAAACGRRRERQAWGCTAHARSQALGWRRNRLPDPAR